MRIDWRDPDGRPEGAVTRAAALRWTAAGLAVVAVHAGGIGLALHWPAQAETPGDPPAAIMMELAPLAVAPGIAEALLATALGLVAAIPAVIIYNVFARALASYRALLSDASGEIVQHISRDLERQERGLVSSVVSLGRARPAAE
jgi:hypothetical protein